MRVFVSEGYGNKVEAQAIELSNPDATPGTFGWLTRFSIVTTGTTKDKWPSICAYYVEGIVDVEGNWIADFPEPTAGNPTTF